MELELTIYNDDTLSKKSLYYYGLGKKLYSKEFSSDGTVTSEKIFHQDILGNNVLITDTSGDYLEKTLFGPFGDVITEQKRGKSIESPNRYNFTGKERDSESDLDYFGARYLDYNNGRWMKPDVIQGHLESPQSLNKFAYCHNRPLFFTDPDGYDVEVITRPLRGILGSGGLIRHGIIHIFHYSTINIQIFHCVEISVSVKVSEYYASVEKVPSGKPAKVHAQYADEMGKFTPTDDHERREVEAIKTTSSKFRRPIQVPEGMTKEAFEKGIMDRVDDVRKDPPGYRAVAGPNSNSFYDRIFSSFGIVLEQLFGAVAQKSKRTDADWEIGRRMMEENVRRWENEWINNNQVGYFSTGYHTQSHVNK